MKVFPKCDHSGVDRVSDNVMSVFDRAGYGTVSFKDLLLAFSMTMTATEDSAECDPEEKLGWMYRFADQEEDAK